jgi:hypothetical protein
MTRRETPPRANDEHADEPDVSTSACLDDSQTEASIC